MGPKRLQQVGDAEEIIKGGELQKEGSSPALAGVLWSAHMQWKASIPLGVTACWSLL